MQKCADVRILRLENRLRLLFVAKYYFCVFVQRLERVGALFDLECAGLKCHFDRWILFYVLGNR